MYKKICIFSSYLKKNGIKKNDRIAAYVPNTIETIITFLGTAKNGGIWSSCSPDFGVQGVVDRFFQIEPKIFEEVMFDVKIEKIERPQMFEKPYACTFTKPTIAKNSSDYRELYGREMKTISREKEIKNI